MNSAKMYSDRKIKMKNQQSRNLADNYKSSDHSKVLLKLGNFLN